MPLSRRELARFTSTGSGSMAASRIITCAEVEVNQPVTRGKRPAGMCFEGGRQQHERRRPVPVQNGDYVLLRMQKSADDGDIVAAESRTSTRTVMQRPRSNAITNVGPMSFATRKQRRHPPFEFAPGQPPPKIRGSPWPCSRCAPSPKELRGIGFRKPMRGTRLFHFPRWVHRESGNNAIIY